MTDWIDNTGTVPDGVEADTVIEVEYRNGESIVWTGRGAFPNNRASYWWLDGGNLNIIRWRKVPA